MDITEPAKRRHNGVDLFIRILMATTGVITSLAGALLCALRVAEYLALESSPDFVPRTLTISVLFGVALTGLCWIALSLSDRLWK